jgi:hypothetical protein
MSGCDRVRTRWTGTVGGLLGLLAACASPQKTAPAAAAPWALAAPPVRPDPGPATTDWRDLPPSPGDWTYAADSSGSQAAFGPAGEPAALVLRCETGRREIRLSRPATAAAPLVVRTSYGTRDLTAGGASLRASDGLLDEIAFSRGRFTVEAAGSPALIVPAWAEPARVIEDCRG